VAFKGTLKAYLATDFYQFTYVYNPVSMEPPVAQLFKATLTFYATRRFITVLIRSLHWSLSCAKLIQSTPLHPISLWFILILSNHKFGIYKIFNIFSWGYHQLFFFYSENMIHTCQISKAFLRWGFFFEPLYIAIYTESNNRIKDKWWLVNNFKGNGRCLIEVLPRNMQGDAGEHHKNSQSEQPGSRQRFELNISWI
jgi:hypothetical protein